MDLLNDEQDAQQSPAQIDWNALRISSLLLGGFGDQRVHLWPALLNATPASTATSTETPHHDEHQIHLDTERSFVFYPVGELLNPPSSIFVY